MAQRDSPYLLMESYAKLQGVYLVLKALSLPEDVLGTVGSIKVWLDEWEDLSIHGSPVMRYLEGKGSGRCGILRGAMDGAYEALTSKDGMLLCRDCFVFWFACTTSPGSVLSVSVYLPNPGGYAVCPNTRGLLTYMIRSSVKGLSRPVQEQTSTQAGLARRAKHRIQQALRALRITHGVDQQKQQDEVPAAQNHFDKEEEQQRHQPDATWDKWKIKRAKARIQLAWEGLMIMGQEALGEGVPEFKWWDYENKLNMDAHIRSDIIKIEIEHHCGPILSPPKEMTGGRRGYEMSPAVMQHRLLEVLARRLLFLDSRFSCLGPLIDKEGDFKLAVKKAFEDKNRKLPEKPDGEKLSEDIWRYVIYVSSIPTLSFLLLHYPLGTFCFTSFSFANGLGDGQGRHLCIPLLTECTGSACSKISALSSASSKTAV